MPTLQEDFLLAFLKSQLNIEKAKFNSIHSPNQENLDIRLTIGAAINEIERQIKQLKIVTPLP